MKLLLFVRNSWGGLNNLWTYKGVEGSNGGNWYTNQSVLAVLAILAQLPLLILFQTLIVLGDKPLTCACVVLYGFTSMLGVFFF